MVYANTYYTYLTRLIKLNNKIIRILFKKPIKTHTSELYTLCNTLPINLLHDLHLLKLVHKIMYNKDAIPDVFINYFSLITDNMVYELRDNVNLKVNRFNTSIGQRSFVYKGVKLWNSLPAEVKITKNVREFNRIVKEKVLLT